MGSRSSKVKAKGNVQQEKNEVQITEYDTMKLQLKQQIRKLEIQANKLQRDADKQQDKAKELLAAGDKERAMTALQFRRVCLNQQKAYANQMIQLQAAYGNLRSVEAAKLMKEALGACNTYMREANIENLTNELQEAMAESAEYTQQVKQLDTLLASAGEDVDFDMDEEMRLLAEEVTQQTADRISVPTTQLQAKSEITIENDVSQRKQLVVE